MYRQGDLLIQKCAGPIPKSAKPVARENGVLVAAYGEVTGHMHSIAEMDAEMFGEREGVLYLKAPSGASLAHQEHSALTLAPCAPGEHYTIQRQQQWVGEPKRVLD